MEIVLFTLSSVWNFLTEKTILDVPVIYVLVGLSVLGLIMSFVMGKKS